MLNNNFYGQFTQQIYVKFRGRFLTGKNFLFFNIFSALLFLRAEYMENAAGPNGIRGDSGCVSLRSNGRIAGIRSHGEVLEWLNRSAC
jgi:hypothetical protein